MITITAKKKSIARRMAEGALKKLAHKGGNIGRFAAEADSYMSRHLDKGKGVYAELK